VAPPYTGRELLAVLTDMGYVPVDRTGSHVQLRYEQPTTGEVRTVTVPMGGGIDTGTLYSIADQCGATDFREWCAWIDDHS